MGIMGCRAPSSGLCRHSGRRARSVDLGSEGQDQELFVLQGYDVVSAASSENFLVVCQYDWKTIRQGTWSAGC
jgi:hypothetical protein